MKKILGLFITVAFIGFSVLAFTPTPSYALPNFAKKFEASCTLCHTVWPALNRFGERYLINGFQMPDTEDGGDVGKIKPDENLSLDSGNANPPLSVRMTIETFLTRDTTIEGASTDSRSALVEAKAAETPFFVAGTLGKNISYFVDNASNATKQEQMWMGIHNIGGAGTANIRYGIINNADFDAWSNHRHDLGNSFAGDVASDTHIDPVGLQVYGRPGFGPLTYQVNADTHYRTNTNSLNYGLMLRGDFEPVAVSYHYASGAAKSAFGSAGKDITTTSQILGVRAILTGIEVSGAYALMSKDDQSSGTSSKTDISGLVLEGIYFAELFDIQARYSSLTNSKIANATSGISNYDRSRISLKVDYHATLNSKLFFKYETPSFKGDSLKSTGVYADTSSTGCSSAAPCANYNDDYASIGVDVAF